jgi:hypothetical protein
MPRSLSGLVRRVCGTAGQPGTVPKFQVANESGCCGNWRRPAVPGCQQPDSARADPPARARDEGDPAALLNIRHAVLLGALDVPVQMIGHPVRISRRQRPGPRAAPRRRSRAAGRPHSGRARAAVPRRATAPVHRRTMTLTSSGQRAQRVEPVPRQRGPALCCSNPADGRLAKGGDL